MHPEKKSYCPKERACHLAVRTRERDRMEIDSILKELEENRGYFPREAIEEAIRRREEITPHLMRALQEAVERPVDSTEEEASFLPLYALFLLAQFRERRAYPLIMNLCKLPHESLDALIGDTITEGLPRIIASVFDGDTQPIKSLIENASIDEYVRGSGIRSLSVLAHEGILERDEVIAYFTELFRTRLEREPSHVWDELASEAVDLYAKTLADDIREAYENGLLWPGYMAPEEVEQVFAMQEKAVLARSQKRHKGPIDDVVEEMHWWACFSPRKESRVKAAEPFRPAGGRQEAGTGVRSAPKIGRNAPCPCGSGKKYKKCCGR